MVPMDFLSKMQISLVIGEGLRYEINDFVAAILSNGYYHSKVSKKENLKMAEVQEQYIKGKNLFKL